MMARRWLLGCLLAGFIMVPAAGFSQALTGEKYLLAKKALNSGDMEQFERLKSQLVDHPLYPYLDYFYLLRHFNTVDDALIEKYIETYPNSPMAHKLRSKRLDELAQAQQWDAVLSLYRPTKRVSSVCQYLMALHQTGAKKQAFDQVKSLWLTTKEHPESCQSLFDVWLTDSQQQESLLWKRFDMAMQEKKIELARSLRDKMSKAQKHHATQILRLYKNPRLVKNKDFLKRNTNTDVISYGISRLARISPADGINTWKKLRERYTFDMDDEQRIFQSVGLTMTLRNNKNATKWFRKVIGRELAPVYKDWMMRSGILHQDWQFVVDSIKGLPADEQLELRWQYWYGRALGELGRTQESMKVLSSIAGERNYYGFMASHYLKQPIVVKNEPLTISVDELNQVRATPGFQRAKLFYQMNLKHRARVELFTLMWHMSEKDQYIVTKLISEWGWHPQALRLSHYADHKDDIDVRFPLPFLDTILAQANQYKVDPALIYAIMRQESYFTTFANSHAGAIGLMQLMPATASRTAKQFALAYAGKDDLLNAQKNIKLGSAHLNKLQKDLHAHPVLMIAAYNAGKKPVHRWLAKNKTLPTDIWVESVTYKETRKYLRNVIACYVVYQHRLGHKPNLTAVMRPVMGS